MADAPIQFTVTLPGQEQARIALQRFAVNLSDFTKFWTDYLVPNWYRHIAVQYETQGGATGAPWQPLTAAYAAWKQKHWPGLPIGVLSGSVRESLTFPDDANSILNISKDKMEVGTSVRHAIYLQLGTSRMPARSPLRVNEEFMLLCGKLLQEFGWQAGRDAGVS